MKIKVKENTLSAFENVKGKWLLNESGDIMIVREVEYVHEKPEEENEPALQPNTSKFKRRKDRLKAKAKEGFYITGLEVEGYHPEGKFVGTYNEDYCTTMIERQDSTYYTFSVYTLRNAWEKHEEAINAFKEHEKELKEEEENS